MITPVVRFLSAFVSCAAGLGALAQPQPPGEGMDPYVRVVEANRGDSLRLEVSVRSMRPANGAGPVVHLVGVVHIGDKVYYDKVQEFLNAQDLVLYEGVKPEAAGKPVEGDDAARARVTASRQRTLALMIATHRRTHGSLPESLDALLAELDGGAARLAKNAISDGWGRAQTYVVFKEADTGRTRYDLISLGADGAEGGEGPAADVKFSSQKPLTKREVDEAGEGIQAKLASALGLEFQLTAIDYTNPAWRNSDLSIDEVERRLEEKGASGDMLFKMLDGSSFSAKLLGMILGMIEKSPEMSMMAKIMMVETIAHADAMLEAQPGDMAKVMEVIIVDRNTAVLDDLRRALNEEQNVKSIALFYGAGHLPDFEARLVRDFRYVFDADRWYTAVDVDLTSVPGAKTQAKQMRAMIKNMIEQQAGKKDK